MMAVSEKTDTYSRFASILESGQDSAAPADAADISLENNPGQLNYQETLSVIPWQS